MKVEYAEELAQLCVQARRLIGHREYEACREALCEAMARFPDAPHPHNLMGILLEQERNHPLAMRHFRAAIALDPSYLPAGDNLQYYGTFLSAGRCAYDESDCRR